MALGALTCAACVGLATPPEAAPAPASFYTVTAEIALARHEPRVAALQYAAGAANATDPALLKRATQVAVDTLQPSLAEQDAVRWINLDPGSQDAQRAAAKADLALQRIGPAAAHYRVVLAASPSGPEAEFDQLEIELAGNDNIFGARQLADRLAAWFPRSPAALRMQGFAALRADDPAAAVRNLTAALALPDASPGANAVAARRELTQALARARILAGDVDAPLAAGLAELTVADTPVNRLDYVLLLMTAQREPAAIRQLEILAKDPEYSPVALRLMGLIEYQQGHFDVATASFAELVRTEKFQDDACFYLALIADRHDDVEIALRFYAQVQSGENSVPAMLRATALLHRHGAATTAQELLDRLIEDEPQRAPEILIARARMDADAGDLPRALTVLEQAVMEYPDSVELRYALASTYEEQGRIPAALRELSDLVKSRPDDPAALNALGYTLADHERQLRRARKLIERAYAQSPRNPAILDSLGWVLFRQGHGVEAEAYLRTAYADDRGGDIAAHLGEVLWQLGKPADAERVWSEAGAADGENRLLKATRRRLHAAPEAASRPRQPVVPGTRRELPQEN